MCPVLFMGAGYGENAGFAYPHYYEEYQVTAISFEDADETGKYPFSITLENTGDEYIAIDKNFSLEYSDHYYQFYNDAVTFDDDKNSGLCLAPLSSQTYKSLTPAFETFTLEECTHSCYAYEIFTDIEVEFTGFTYLGKDTIDDCLYYNFQANDYSFHDDGYYYYSKVVDVTIKGEHFAFFDDFANEKISLALANDSLTSEDIVIEDLKLIQGTDSGKKFSEYLLMGLRWAAIAIFGGALVIFTLGVFPIFILPSIIKKSKQKHNKS